MRPAAVKAPMDYLFALVVCLIVIAVSFAVEPPETRWIVFGVGCVMAVAVLAAAARPVRD